MPARVKVADILKPIDEVKTQAYFGRHLHTLGLIKWILSQIGPADVWVSSYSTSEEFLRGFRLMRDSGSISSAKMLLDVKASKKTVHLWRLMSACFDDVYLGENHSKVTLFRNDQHVVSVVTSQNQTYGSRDESTIITTEPQVFADLFNGYTSHCDNQSLRINGNYSGVTQQSARAGREPDSDLGDVRSFWILRRMFCVMRFSTLHQSSGASIIWAWQKSGSRFAGMSWSWLQPAHLKPYSAHMNI